MHEQIGLVSNKTVTAVWSRVIGSGFPPKEELILQLWKYSKGLWLLLTRQDMTIRLLLLRARTRHCKRKFDKTEAEENSTVSEVEFVSALRLIDDFCWNFRGLMDITLFAENAFHENCFDTRRWYFPTKLKKLVLLTLIHVNYWWLNFAGWTIIYKWLVLCKLGYPCVIFSLQPIPKFFPQASCWKSLNEQALGS
jgi:hypothetical protein